MSKTEIAYKSTRDFTSFLKNFERINTIERKSKSNVNAVPIRSINESDVIVKSGVAALNDIASAMPKIMMLNVQLPMMSP